MPVDPVFRLPTYSVSQSNEANDEERRKEKNKGEKDKKNNGAKTTPTQSATPDTSQEKTDLPSQLVDSEKVLELLSQKPHLVPQPKTAHFVDKAPQHNVKNPSEIPQKKLNKSA